MSDAKLIIVSVALSQVVTLAVFWLFRSHLRGPQGPQGFQGPMGAMGPPGFSDEPPRFPDEPPPPVEDPVTVNTFKIKMARRMLLLAENKEDKAVARRMLLAALGEESDDE